MSQRYLSYSIIQHKKFIGQGRIDNIKHKSNDKFVVYSDKDDQFQVVMKLTKPSKVTRIQMRLVNVWRYQLKLMKAKNVVVEEFNEIVNSKHTQITLVCNIKAQETKQVSIKLENCPENKKRLGICYIMFKGIEKDKQKQQNQHNQRQKSGKKSSLHQATVQHANLVRQALHSESKQFFRQKQQRPKTSKQDLINLAQYYQLQQNFDKSMQPPTRKKVKVSSPQKKSPSKPTRAAKLKEKQDTELAIALSRSQQQMKQKAWEEKMLAQYEKMQVEDPMDYEVIQIDSKQPQNQLQKMDNYQQDSIPSALKNYIDHQDFHQQQPRTYQTVPLTPEYLSYFSNLTPKWLQAQRQAQHQSQIRESQRLSNHIQLKYLHNTELFIGGFPEWKQDQLQDQGKTLGCRIVKELKNHCLAIVSKELCEKLKRKHKEWKEVKYLRYEYLEDCIREKAALSYRDYYIRV